MDVFAEGLKDPEGPVLLPGGGWLVTEMHPSRGCVTEISPDGVRTTLAVTGRPNGCAVAADGTIWVAESSPPAILALHRDGTVRDTWTGPASAPFLWPNDLCFGPDGKLYFTDSGVLFETFAPDGEVRPDEIGSKRAIIKDNASGRLFRLDPRSREIELLRSGLHFPNGIAFAPDDTLYVAETVTGDILGYDLDRAGALHDRGVHANVIPEDLPGAFIGPDGIAVDEDGHLYACVLGFGHIAIVDPSGAVVERLDAGGPVCTNVAFGPSGSRTIFVTEDSTGRMIRLPARADGATLHGGEPHE